MGQWVQAHHVSFSGIPCAILRKSCTFCVCVSKTKIIIPVKRVLYLPISWRSPDEIYTAVDLPAVTCGPVGGFIQTSPWSSFPVCGHRMVPWKCLVWQGVTCFRRQHPSKRWVTKGFPSTGNCSCISSHQTRGYFITWGETWSH